MHPSDVRGLIPISMFSATISPSKGKGKDGATSTTWRPGWWDFLPLTETCRRYVLYQAFNAIYALLSARPVQWTASSTLVTAHPHIPALIGRHISSETQFMLPPLITQKEGMPRYEIASVLLAHPTEDYVFAYYPGRQGSPGAGVIYHRKLNVNDWAICSPIIQFQSGAGVVGGRWLPNTREVCKVMLCTGFMRSTA